MENRTILALQGPTGTPNDLDDLVRNAREHNGHLSVVQVGAVAPIPINTVGGMPYGGVSIPDEWIQARRDMIVHLENQAAKTADLMDREAVSGEAKMICSNPGDLGRAIAPHAFFADLVVIQNELRDETDAFRELLYGVLFQSPAPVLLNMAAATLTPDNVMIAWNTSLPAAGAVRAALPLLKTAKSVTIMSIDPTMSETADGEDPGANLAKWLSHHGCNVTVQQVPGGGADTGKVMLRRAKDIGADLIVMGAYGRSRLREAIFGGTTRSMIEQTEMPVLLSH